MKLYVCYGTFKAAPRPGGHPCGSAYHALRYAGHEPEVVKAYGLAGVPLVNKTQGRREVKELTGSETVPMLVTDTGEVIADSKKIVAWAQANPGHAGA